MPRPKSPITAKANSGVGNFGAIGAVEQPWHSRPASAAITLPPLATVWLRYEPEAAADEAEEATEQ